MSTAQPRPNPQPTARLQEDCAKLDKTPTADGTQCQDKTPTPAPAPAPKPAPAPMPAPAPAPEPSPTPSPTPAPQPLTQEDCEKLGQVLSPDGKTCEAVTSIPDAQFPIETVGQVSLDEVLRVKAFFVASMKQLENRTFTYKAPKKISIYGFAFEGGPATYHSEGSSWSARLTKQDYTFKVPQLITIHGFAFEGWPVTSHVDGARWSASVEVRATAENIQSLIMSQGVEAAGPIKD